MSAWLNLIKYFVIKDIRARYAGSGLGILWSLLTPVFQIVIYVFVFSTVMKTRPYGNTAIPYSLFLLSTFFFWLAFSEGILRASGVILENADMVKKISFPNIVLPVSVTVSTYLPHMVGFLLFLVYFALRFSLGAPALLVIPVVILQLAFTIGIGVLLAAFMPYVRDISQLLGYVIQGLFFLSPVLYSFEAIPEKLRFLFYLNPFTYFAASYQKIILSGELPPAGYWAIIIVLSVATLAAGVAAFQKLREGFPDVL